MYVYIYIFIHATTGDMQREAERASQTSLLICFNRTKRRIIIVDNELEKQTHIHHRQVPFAPVLRIGHSNQSSRNNHAKRMPPDTPQQLRHWWASPPPRVLRFFAWLIVSVLKGNIEISIFESLKIESWIVKKHQWALRFFELVFVCKLKCC